MSSIALSGNASGAGVFTIASPNSASSYTLTLPAATGTLVAGANANSVALPGSTSGTITLTAPAVAGTNTITLAAQTGTLNVAGPAFSAYASTTQSITSNVHTKVAIDTEIFDTNSCFDTATYRFTPTVAGYYQVNGHIRLSANATTISQAVVSIFKNGTTVGAASVDNFATTVITSYVARSINTLVYLNGSTDYIELYGSITGTSPQFIAGSATATASFSASLVRGA